MPLANIVMGRLRRCALGCRRVFLAWAPKVDTLHCLYDSWNFAAADQQLVRLRSCDQKINASHFNARARLGPYAKYLRERGDGIRDQLPRGDRHSTQGINVRDNVK